MEENKKIGSNEDDGSLSFLKIKLDDELKFFHCPKVSPAELVNKTFWILDYCRDVKTKYGEGRYVAKIKENVDDDDNTAKKVVISSKELKCILDKIAELNAFPRRVTMRKDGSQYFFE